MVQRACSLAGGARRVPRAADLLAHFGKFTGVDAGGGPAESAAAQGCFDGISSHAWSYRATEAGTDEAARERLLALLPRLDAHAGGLLGKRLIYGSDWFMNNLNGPHDRSSTASRPPSARCGATRPSSPM